MEHKCPQVANPDNCIPFVRTVPSLKERQFNVTGLLPYMLYIVRIKAYNDKASFAESLKQEVRTFGKGNCLFDSVHIIFTFPMFICTHFEVVPHRSGFWLHVGVVFILP